jgi:hypothetical protein
MILIPRISLAVTTINLLALVVNQAFYGIQGYILLFPNSLLVLIVLVLSF